MDAMHLSLDVLRTLNMSHGQLFTRNTGLLMDRMRDTVTCTTPDLSQTVSIMTTICTSKVARLSSLEWVILSHGSLA